MHGKRFDSKHYELYTNFTGTTKNQGKHQAKMEAVRLRSTGNWLARVVKSPYGGWDIYTRNRKG